MLSTSHLNDAVTFSYGQASVPVRKGLSPFCWRVLSGAPIPELRAEKIDNRNFAFDTYYPTPNEIQLAEQRARKYWAKHAARFGNNPFYLAVETSKIFPGDVHGLSPKLNHSETTASNRRRSYSYLEIKGVMIFDIRTGHFVGNMGFMSVDTPPLGGLARFDHYIARYIGFGNWP